MTGGAAEPLGVYVHWPFCLSKCPYCDFNSHVRATIDEAGWRAALLAELDGQAARLRGRIVGSVFFGGGTPSLMAPDTVAAILDRIAARFALAEDVEITLEANPNSAEAARFRDLARAGIGRVSIGVQALDDAALRLLGRAHPSVISVDGTGSPAEGADGRFPPDDPCERCRFPWVPGVRPIRELRFQDARNDRQNRVG